MKRKAYTEGAVFQQRPFLLSVMVLGALLLVGCRVQTASAPDKTALPLTETAVATEPPPSPTTDDATAAGVEGGTAAPTTEPTASGQYSDQADADVRFVEAQETGPGVWTFRVTVAHADTGWEDYADGWDVVLPDGTVVKPNPDDPFTRLLLHPHENEQPFTRSQSGIEIPEGVEIVTVRAHELVHGFGGREIRVDITTSATTDDYEVSRLEE